jgi:hypothetical protein
MSDQVTSRIIALKSEPVTALKMMWRDLFDSDPPTNNRSWLERRLSYRIQELAFGGLKTSTVKRLEKLGAQLEKEQKAAAGKRTDLRPLVGTKLIREHQGANHEVTVHFNHYEYLGVPFKSLSAVAKNITGVSWNGPVFFGLRSAKNSKS